MEFHWRKILGLQEELEVKLVLGKINRREYVFVFFVCALIVLWILRPQIIHGFNGLHGDLFDTSIEITILEHWYNVFRGLASWTETNYFYPYNKTLGYNDGYFIYGALYSPLRAIGIDPYLATFFVHVILRVLGLIFFYIWARAVLKLPIIISLIGSATFVLSNNLWIHTGHAQLLSVIFVPLAAYLIVKTYAKIIETNPPEALAYWIAFCILFGAWAMTAYYMLWFFVFFVLICLISLFIARRNLFIFCAKKILEMPKMYLLIMLLAFVLCITPFLYLYLGKAIETGMHAYSGMIDYIPKPVDILNIGPNNFLYGQLVDYLNRTVGFPISFSERQMGLTPILVLALVFSLIYFYRKRNSLLGLWPSNMVWIFCIAVAVVYWFSLQLFKQSDWWHIYYMVPGAKAVRVVSRIYIFLTFPVLTIVLFYMTKINKNYSSVIVIGLLSLILLEQINATQHRVINRNEAMSRLNEIKQYPTNCTSFYVTDTRKVDSNNIEDIYYRHNVEAMLISEYINLPTVNGFSSFNPPTWRFDHPEDSSYTNRAMSYMVENHVQNYCSLNLANLEWSN